MTTTITVSGSSNNSNLIFGSESAVITEADQYSDSSLNAFAISSNAAYISSNTASISSNAAAISSNAAAISGIQTTLTNNVETNVIKLNQTDFDDGPYFAETPNTYYILQENIELGKDWNTDGNRHKFMYGISGAPETGKHLRMPLFGWTAGIYVLADNVTISLNGFEILLAENAPGFALSAWNCIVAGSSMMSMLSLTQDHVYDAIAQQAGLRDHTSSLNNKPPIPHKMVNNLTIYGPGALYANHASVMAHHVNGLRIDNVRCVPWTHAIHCNWTKNAHISNIDIEMKNDNLAINLVQVKAYATYQVLQLNKNELLDASNNSRVITAPTAPTVPLVYADVLTQLNDYIVKLYDYTLNYDFATNWAYNVFLQNFRNNQLYGIRVSRFSPFEPQHAGLPIMNCLTSKDDPNTPQLGGENILIENITFRDILLANNGATTDKVLLVDWDGLGPGSGSSPLSGPWLQGTYDPVTMFKKTSASNVSTTLDWSKWTDVSGQLDMMKAIAYVASTLMSLPMLNHSLFPGFFAGTVIASQKGPVAYAGSGLESHIVHMGANGNQINFQFGLVNPTNLTVAANILGASPGSDVSGTGLFGALQSMNTASLATAHAAGLPIAVYSVYPVLATGTSIDSGRGTASPSLIDTRGVVGCTVRNVKVKNLLSIDYDDALRLDPFVHDVTFEQLVSGFTDPSLNGGNPVAPPVKFGKNYEVGLSAPLVTQLNNLSSGLGDNFVNLSLPGSGFNINNPQYIGNDIIVDQTLSSLNKNVENIAVYGVHNYNMQSVLALNCNTPHFHNFHPVANPSPGGNPGLMYGNGVLYGNETGDEVSYDYKNYFIYENANESNNLQNYTSIDMTPQDILTLKNKQYKLTISEQTAFFSDVSAGFGSSGVTVNFLSDSSNVNNYFVLFRSSAAADISGTDLSQNATVLPKCLNLNSDSHNIATDATGIDMSGVITGITIESDSAVPANLELVISSATDFVSVTPAFNTLMDLSGVVAGKVGSLTSIGLLNPNPGAAGTVVLTRVTLFYTVNGSECYRRVVYN